jgi:glutathione S-transferase
MDPNRNLGQLGHFEYFAKEKIPYAIQRYKNESLRLMTVLDIHLKNRDWVATGTI